MTTKRVYCEVRTKCLQCRNKHSPLRYLQPPQYSHHLNLYVVQISVNVVWGNNAYLNVKCFSSSDLEAVFSVVCLQSKETGSHDGQ